MDLKKAVRDFYHDFEKMDAKGILSHFAPHAKIYSPVFGHKEPNAFYQEAFSRTKSIKVHLKDIFVNPDNPQRLAVYLTFHWEMKNGKTMSFEGVVLFTFNSQGKIQQIDIIYDAQRARDAVA